MQRCWCETDRGGGKKRSEKTFKNMCVFSSALHTCNCDVVRTGLPFVFILRLLCVNWHTSCILISFDSSLV